MGRGSRTSLKNHKNIGFPSNIDRDPLKITKLPSQNSMVGHYRHASKLPFQWRFSGRLMMAHFRWHFDPLSIPSTKTSQCWTPADKTFWIRSSHEFGIHPLYLNCNPWSITITDSLVYLGTHILVEIQFINFSAN